MNSIVHVYLFINRVKIIHVSLIYLHIISSYFNKVHENISLDTAYFIIITVLTNKINIFSKESL